jgi:two-component system KDP operon response regulator KdpE
MLPGMSGLEITRWMRSRNELSGTPFLFVPAKTEPEHIATGLDAGADDYVTKPFGMGEFLARVRAALRRSPEPAEDEPLISDGDFNVDLSTRTVQVAGKPVKLSPKEFDHLLYFIRHAGKVLTHRTLLAHIWGGDYLDQTEYLRVFVRHLRKKIEPDPAKPRYILTEPWVGYRFLPSK